MVLFPLQCDKSTNKGFNDDFVRIFKPTSAVSGNGNVSNMLKVRKGTSAAASRWSQLV